jgi:hypothetical protein
VECVWSAPACGPGWAAPGRLCAPQATGLPQVGRRPAPLLASRAAPPPGPPPPLPPPPPAGGGPQRRLPAEGRGHIRRVVSRGPGQQRVSRRRMVARLGCLRPAGGAASGASCMPWRAGRAALLAGLRRPPSPSVPCGVPAGAQLSQQAHSRPRGEPLPQRQGRRRPEAACCRRRAGTAASTRLRSCRRRRCTASPSCTASRCAPPRRAPSGPAGQQPRRAGGAGSGRCPGGRLSDRPAQGGGWRPAGGRARRACSARLRVLLEWGGVELGAKRKLAGSGL